MPELERREKEKKIEDPNNHPVEMDVELKNKLFEAIETADNGPLDAALGDCKLEELLSLKNEKGQPLLHYAAIHQNLPAFKLIIDKIEASQEPGLKEKALLSSDAQGNSLLAYINVTEKRAAFLYTFANLLKNQVGDHPLVGFDSAGQPQAADLKRDIESGDLGAIKRYSDQGNSFRVRYPATASQRPLANSVQEPDPEVVRDTKITQPGGNTPLHSAVQANQLAIVQYIVDSDPQLLSWTNFSGQTALQVARQCLLSGTTDQQKRQQAIVDYLSQQQQELSDPKVLEQRTNQQLFRTIAAGGTTDLHYFLEALADLTPLLEIKNAQGQSLLHCAINARNQQATQLILEKIKQDKGAKKILSQTDAQGNSVLHYAVTTQDIVLICRLVAAGVDLALKNSDQRTVHQEYQLYQPDTYKSLEDLPKTIESGDLSSLKAYVVHGFPLQVRYRNGNNPLHLAVQGSQSDIVEYLLDNNSQLLTAKNFDGETPKDLASVALEAQKGTIATLQQTLQLMKEKEQPLSETDVKVQKYNEQALQAAERAKERFDTILQALSTVEDNRENWIQPVVKPELLAPEPLNPQQVKEVATLFEEFNKITEPTQEQQQSFRDTLQPYVPTVWSVAQTYCDSALQALQAQQDRPESKQLLGSLLGSTYDSAAVERQIKRVAYHLQEVKNRDEIVRSIELQTTGHDEQVAGWVDPDQIEFGEIKKIHLVPHKHKNLVNFVHTLVHEVSHIANRSVDFSYMHSKKALAEEPQESAFNQLFKGLVQLATTGQPDILKFNRSYYRIFEIALINKLLSGQCAAKEVEEILKGSNKVMALIHRESQLVDNNVKLITQEDLQYASLATDYGHRGELSTLRRILQTHDLQQGKKFIGSPQHLIENFRALETCDQEKVAALQAQAQWVKPMIVLHNADSIAVSIGVLAGLQGYQAVTSQEDTAGFIVPSIEQVETGLLNLAGLAKVDENPLPDVSPPPKSVSSEASLIQSLKAKIELLTQEKVVASID